MKVLNPTSGFPTWGSSERLRNPQGIWLCRPAGFGHKIFTGLWKQTLHSWRTQTKSCMHRERSSGPAGDWADLPASVGGSPVEVWVGSGSPRGLGHWQQQSLEVLPLAWALLEVTINSTIEPVVSRAGSPQTKQLIGREHRPCRQSDYSFTEHTLPTRARPSFSHC